jgi:hypothetical protein
MKSEKRSVMKTDDDIIGLIRSVIDESVGSLLNYGKKAKSSSKDGIESSSVRQVSQGNQQTDAMDDAMDDDDSSEDSPKKVDNKQDTDEQHHDDETVTVTIDSVITKLNTIRSGRSFKDSDLYNEMQHYFESLDDPERLALYAFLTGLP